MSSIHFIQRLLFILIVGVLSSILFVNLSLREIDQLRKSIPTDNPMSMLTKQDIKNQQYGSVQLCPDTIYIICI